MTKAQLSQALTSVKAGDFTPYEVELLSQGKVLEAIPPLEQQFTSDHEIILRAKIAQTLVKMGDKNPIYWDFLNTLAAQALSSDAPEFLNYDQQGREGPGPSPAFQAWVTAHNLKMSTEWANAIYIYPSEILLLGQTEDARALVLLRQALKSPNYQLQVMAALELAELRDSASVPLIVEAAQRAPHTAANQIASSLVFFDDPRAKEAVDQYVEKKWAQSLRASKAQGHTPFH